MMKIYGHLILWIATVFALSACTSTGAERTPADADSVYLDKSLVPRPPMGWNGWDTFGFYHTDENVRSVADYMAENLAAVGYEYVVVDMGWYITPEESDYARWASNQFPRPDYALDTVGRLIPDPKKFPSSRGGKGFKALADYVHNLGLKFGIHIMRGIPWSAAEQNLTIQGTDIGASTIADSTDGCEWYEGMYGVDMSKPGSQEYYNSLFDLYASWEVDYVKADDQVNEDELIAINKAIAQCGRPMVLSIVGDVSDEAQQRYSHLWRISTDFWDDWEMLKAQFGNAIHWAPTIGEQGWPDLDMMPIGKVGKYICYKGPERQSAFNEDELHTLFTLWYIVRSPLMLGGDLPETDSLTLSLIKNTEALAVNQRSENNRLVKWMNAEMVWTADVPDSDDKYVALFNVFGCGPLELGLAWEEIGLEGNSYRVRDLWKQEDIGAFAGKFTQQVNQHGAGLYRITADVPGK